MLTILHDETFTEGQSAESAWAEGVSIVAFERSTCLLARALIEEGFDPNTLTRLVKADPYLSSPPHRIENLTLFLVATIDFFGKPEETAGPSLKARSSPVRRPQEP